MDNKLADSKRIVKNTMMLYVRMLFTLIISLFTTRVVLDTLGVSDYGLYNLVAGVVGLMSVVSSLLSQGTTRFLTVALGKGDHIELKKTLSSAVIIHFIFAIIILVLGESLGPYFIERLNIPIHRMRAAQFVFQFSLISAVITVLQTPFHSAIIAHEKMHFYAFVSIWDAVAKLLIVYLLLVINVDKLKLYSALYFAVSVLTLIIYYAYSRRCFEECRYIIDLPDLKIWKSMFNYIGWNAIGSVAFTMNNQGLTILLNTFGTVVNAARGVSMSVSNVVYRFVESFQAAVRPQITKLCAVKDFSSMNTLIARTSKLSSFLIGIIGVPLFLEMDFVLNLWLKEVPNYTIIFTRLTLVQGFIQSIDFPVGAGIHAVGKMKLPNLTSSFIYMIILPVSYLAIKLGSTPQMAYLILICVYPLALFMDLIILKKYSHFDVRTFVVNVLVRSTLILLITSSVTYWATSNIEPGFMKLVIVVVVSMSLNVVLMYFGGLSKSERNSVCGYISLKLSKSNE